jgi:MFS family permease
MADAASRSLWRHADFLKLWAGQSVSEVGSQVTVIAMPLTAVLALHATAFEVGALNAVLMAPFLLFGLPAGAIVDRLPMRMVMLVSDALRLVILGSVPLAATLHGLTLGQLYAVAFLSGICTVFFDVAYQSYLPVIVAKDQLTDGNGKLTASSQIAAVAGPAIGGALVSAIGAAKAIAADAGSYLASVASLAVIRHRSPRPERRDGPVVSGLFADTKEGLRYVLGQPMLRKIAGCTGTANLFGDLGFAIVTVFMVRTLHLSAGQIGLVFAAGSAAGLVGALCAKRLIDRVGVGATIIAGASLTPLGGIAIPLATRGAGVWWVVVGFMIFWIGAIVYNIAQVSLRQAITPHELLGRMNATMRFMVWGPMPVGALIGGALGGALGLREALWISGIGGLLAPLWVIFSPVRHQREMPGDEDEIAEPVIEPSALGPVLEA